MPDFHIENGRLRALSFARAAGGASVALGIIVLFGWQFDSAILTQLVSNSVSMKVNAAVGFIVAGIALIATTYDDTHPVAQSFSAILLVFGALTLSQDVAGLDLRLDQVVMRDLPIAPYTSSPGRMSPITAISFMLFAVAVAAMQQPGRIWFLLGQIALTAVLLQSLTILIGYAYDARELYYPFPYTAIAPHAAAGFAVLSVGLFAAHADRGIARIVINRSSGGLMVRYLLPGIILLPVTLGYLRQFGEEAGYYESSVGTALFTVAMIVSFAALTRATAHVLQHADQQRQQALLDLRRQRERLRTILASIADAVVATDEKGMVEIMNPQAETLTGWSMADAIGRPTWEIFKVLDEETREVDDDPALTTLREHATSRNAQYLLLSADDIEIPIETNSAAIIDENDEVSGAVVVFRDIRGRRETEKQQMLLIRELNHRVRNTLMVVHAIVQKTADQTTNPAKKELAKVLAERLHSLSRAHELLLETQWRGASLKAMIERELEPFREQVATISIDGPDVSLPPQTTAIMAIAIHELTTNAARHGALRAPKGRLRISWRMAEKNLLLKWAEIGAEVAQDRTQGFGHRLIEHGITRNLGGAVKLSFRKGGLHAELTVPIGEAAEHDAGAEPEQLEIS